MLWHHCHSSLIGFSIVRAPSRFVQKIDKFGKRLTPSTSIRLLIRHRESRAFINFPLPAYVSSRDTMESQMKLFSDSCGA